MSVTLAYGDVAVSDCETAWNQPTVTYVTASADTTTRKVGAASCKFVVTADFTTGVIGGKTIPSLDCTASSRLSCWLRSSVELTTGQAQIVLSTSANCGTITKTINLDEITIVDSWTRMDITGIDFSGITGIISVGLKLAADVGAVTVHLDGLVIDKVSLAFTELSCVGFDNPEGEDAFPQAQVRQLLDGSWYKPTPVTATRNILIDLGVIQDGATNYFLRNFQFAANQYVTYGGETLTVISTVNSFPVERSAGTKYSKRYVLALKEKTARAITTKPTSWA